MKKWLSVNASVVAKKAVMAMTTLPPFNQAFSSRVRSAARYWKQKSCAKRRKSRAQQKPILPRAVAASTPIPDLKMRSPCEFITTYRETA
ncbi:hypothetical protein [Niveispirillum fermenti]|uniref:hypothetical protein n=1 Tax=Niveispirillum fermenti TaxID=1233113 RepID=UPI003A8916FC